MTSSLQKVSCTVSDTELRSFVENAVSKFRGSPGRVVRLERKLCDYHSSFAIEDLVAVFDDETRLPLVFKNLGPDGLLEIAREIRPQFAYHPGREIMVYRDILADAGLGTATFYGAMVDLDRQRYWLLLEKIAGDELYKIGDFSIWCDVARWLAGMHDRLANAAKQHQHDTRLLRYDKEFCNAWIDRAEHFVAQRESAAQQIITRPQMKWLADQCRSAVDHICRLPVTIVHCEFYASNVLIQQRGNQTRICPIDWETAAKGPGLIDLAALIAGNWTEQQKQQLAMAYYESLLSEKAIWDRFQDLMTALQSCRLLLAVKWLGWSSDWQPPAEHRCDWIAEAMQLAQAIESDRK